jgi:hypothetical protein
MQDKELNKMMKKASDIHGVTPFRRGGGVLNPLIIGISLAYSNNT